MRNNKFVDDNYMEAVFRLRLYYEPKKSTLTKYAIGSKKRASQLKSSWIRQTGGRVDIVKSHVPKKGIELVW